MTALDSICLGIGRAALVLLAIRIVWVLARIVVFAVRDTCTEIRNVYRAGHSIGWRWLKLPWALFSDVVSQTKAHFGGYETRTVLKQRAS